MHREQTFAGALHPRGHVHGVAEQTVPGHFDSDDSRHTRSYVAKEDKTNRPWTVPLHFVNVKQNQIKPTFHLPECMPALISSLFCGRWRILNLSTRFMMEIASLAISVWWYVFLWGRPDAHMYASPIVSTWVSKEIIAFEISCQPTTIRKALDDTCIELYNPFHPS